jgi:hypothetical protein
MCIFSNIIVIELENLIKRRHKKRETQTLPEPRIYNEYHVCVFIADPGYRLPCKGCRLFNWTAHHWRRWGPWWSIGECFRYVNSILRNLFINFHFYVSTGLGGEGGLGGGLGQALGLGGGTESGGGLGGGLGSALGKYVHFESIFITVPICLINYIPNSLPSSIRRKNSIINHVLYLI